FEEAARQPRRLSPLAPQGWARGPLPKAVAQPRDSARPPGPAPHARAVECAVGRSVSRPAASILDFATTHRTGARRRWEESEESAETSQRAQGIQRAVMQANESGSCTPSSSPPA